MTKSSAFGKIILFGEHAVVYGRPALAVPVTQVYADVDVSDSKREGIWIDAPAVHLQAELKTLPSNHPIAAAIHNLFFLFRTSPFPNLEIKIASRIPVAAGLGSSAAVTVALTRALTSHLRRSMKDEDVNAFAYEIEKIHHGDAPSGIDNTVITYARPVYFVKGQPIETFKVGQPFTFVIGDTGIPAPTNESAEDVRRLWLDDPSRLESVFDKIGEISFAARCAIEAGMYDWLGELMNKNHALLQELTVSSPELDRLVEAARSAGALGAKLSGGGRGGNMIALVKSEMADTVSLVLKTMGAKISSLHQSSKWLTPVLPYLAVGLGLFWFRSAWVALVGFHLAIILSLWLAKPNLPVRILFKSSDVRSVILSIILCSSSGISLYFLWPSFGITGELSAHVQRLGLNSANWTPFIAYFTLVNPWIEEYFWRGYLGSAAKSLSVSDFAYAGFHAMILWQRVQTSSIVSSLGVLIFAGWFWRQLAREDSGLLASVLGHMAADLTILIVVYRMTL